MPIAEFVDAFIAQLTRFVFAYTRKMRMGLAGSDCDNVFLLMPVIACKRFPSMVKALELTLPCRLNVDRPSQL